MIRSCPNCASNLTFNPAMQKLSCEYCGGSFDVSEFDVDETHEKETVNITEKTESTSEISYNVFTCNTCGAEIAVNSTETATFCVYCGNSNIIFSRIKKSKKPDLILPFEVTKEEAEHDIRKKLAKGFFVPKDIKNFKAESIRGIYIPYHISDIDIEGSVIIKGVKKSGKHSHTYYYKRDAFCTFDHITTDASRMLDDSSSIRIEPFPYYSCVPFDEDYLSGFYADVADINSSAALSLAKQRAQFLFEEALLESVSASSKKIIKSNYRVTENPKVRTAFFPAWFLTFRYKDKVYTVIENARTKKIIGAVPWDTKKFVGMFISIATGITAVATMIAYAITIDMSKDSSKAIMYMIFGAIAAFVGGVNYFKRIKKSIERTTAASIIKYANNRQGGQ